MVNRLYADRPELYDAIQAEWDYDRDVAFVETALERRGVDGDDLLEVGCGTGEHTRRFAAAGFDVTAVDPVEGMLSLARGKCDAALLRGALPDLGVDAAFDAVVALRGVVNHLPPDDLGPALSALADCLADGGVLVFDNSPLPPDGNHPALDVGTTERGDYARVAQMRARPDGRLGWLSVVWPPDGGFVADSSPMTPFEDVAVVAALSDLGLSVETHDGFGPGDDRTVVVATG